MKKQNTRRALLMSVLSLVLCVSMLVGTTFAWFTDNVSSGTNTIQSGNLDIELEYYDDAAAAWKVVDGTTDVFGYDNWEPGYTKVVKFRITNKGSLAVKYALSADVADETSGFNKAGEEFLLSDYLYTATVDTAATRDDILAITNGARLKESVTIDKAMLMAAGAQEEVALAIWMPTIVDNDANHNGTDIPEITFSVELFATQAMKETDSFGDDYDKAAPWAGGIDTAWYDPAATEYVIDSAEELAGLAAIVNGTANDSSAMPAAIAQDSFKGKTVKLGADIDLRNLAWTPIGNYAYPFLGDFDGQGHTVYNLVVSNTGWAGLLGHVGKHVGSDIKNVNVVNAVINSNRMAGALVGQLYGSITDCSVKNVEITVIPDFDGTKYDNGDKVGGIVGWLGDNGNNHVISGCTATDVTLKAYRDVGGIAGYVARSTTVADNKVEGNLSITVDQITNYYGDKDFNAGAVYGRTSGAITESGNTIPAEENVTITAKYEKDGLQFKKDGVTDEVALALVPEEYANTVVEIPEGVTTIGGYAFAYNSNVEKIVLPSNVTTLNDRAFRDASASEVVLNEGLTNISYQAFRNALNVTSVTIPSTVETISKEAFQNSGIKELTIPAGVKTIEYGGLRDMKMLESVTIEGNVDIPVYAFRACTNLRTVILKGDDVTFGGGSRGMIFTNKENGDGSAITVYVANETVKERLLAADTAAKDYGGYKIVVGLPTFTESAGDFKTVATQGGTVVLTDKIAVEDLTYVAFGDGAVVNGNGNSLVRDTASGNPLLVNTTNKVTFEDVKFESAKGSAVLGTRKDGANIEVNDCEFINHGSPSTGNVGVQVFANDVTMVFNNCTFNNMPVETNSSYPTGIKLVFNNCTFNWTGDNCPGFIKLANYVEATIDLNGCKMNYTTNSQYTTSKNMISYYSGVGTSTININGLKVTGTRNNTSIWKICSTSKDMTINTSGELGYTFNGEAVDFATYLK